LNYADEDHSDSDKDTRKFLTLSIRQTRMQAREPGVIVIGCNPFASALDSLCRKPRIRHQKISRPRYRKVFLGPNNFTFWRISAIFYQANAQHPNPAEPEMNIDY
jgi:hypothetical protein